ncbi:MAG: glutathione S-transferase family protein [Pseudomonadales bacterium]|nr:glutathione S-transferase family protein [Pseudomonadales bacterium]
MSDYRIFGAELSPYSVKVRSYFRYKGIPHQWIVRNADSAEEYQKYAKIPIIPLVVGPGDEAMQDSTPIIETMEARFSEPSIHPADTTCQFLSALIEEFGDEWGNKWMFHLRWARDEDCASAGGRIAAMNAPNNDETARLAIREQVMERMRERVHFVGSNEVTAPQIEKSFRDAIPLLNAHFEKFPYLFGHRPAFADFGLWGQIYCAWTDPTGSAWIEGQAPHLLDWIHRMLWPTAQGDFAPWVQLSETLTPFVASQIGDLFIPWTLANAACMAAGKDEFTVQLNGETWSQGPQKYHSKSLHVIREKYAAVAGDDGLAEVLASTGCLAGFEG